ncbi:MAG: mechanosensitive ion channel protein MscS [Pelagibacteraceae bacterium TMED65]|nr:MAG: mechanosensitive ion channel protein MscS [Pelagibacteraceae bacterium TMED65]|tara:strand:+ start:865 stop:1959 length:1095 start_codon:yes stop_codon:yes gene_type:complete
MDFLFNINQIFKEVIYNGILGISLLQIGSVTLILVISLLMRNFFANFVVRRIKNLVLKTGNKIDDSLFESLIPPLKLLPIIFVFIFFSLYLQVDTSLSNFIKKINLTLTTIFIFWIIHQSLNTFFIFFEKLERVLTKGLTIWIFNSSKYLLMFLGIVAVLDVWGIKIGPIIAGLGLFGVAVALGAQDLFKNLISGILIIVERRFHLGDIIEVPGYATGTVEHIGFRSTLIRQFDTVTISIPNYVFSDTSIINYSKRKYRRIKWIIGLVYDTSTEQLKKICLDINEYISKDNDFIINNDHQLFVRIEKFSESSIDILVQVFANTNEWEKYLIIKEKLAIKVKEIVEENKSSFAFPSQSIYVENQK